MSYSSFQSLAGFLGRCDRISVSLFLSARIVSIPGGFSWSLRQGDSRGEGQDAWLFQSLAGFLGRCDR